MSEGISFSVMVGVGESYLAAFALALGMGEVASGLIVTVPLLAGGVIQLLAPLGVQLLGSRKKWAVLCAAVQSATFIPLAIGAWMGHCAPWVVYAAATLYWASGMAIGPTWNVWVEWLVPSRVRYRFFARRTAAQQAAVLSGLLAAGIVLQVADASGLALRGFATIFVVAIVGRSVSSALLGRQSEPSGLPAIQRPSRAFELIRRPPRGQGRSLLVYLLALTATVTVASPFFTAYMLRQLELSYHEYTVLIATSLVAKVVVLPFLGRAARRFGLGALLRAAWLGAAPVPALWLVSDSFGYLLALQVISGVAWGLHEYAAFLLLFDTIEARDRAEILTAYNLGNAMATVGGSLLGGLIYERVGGGLAGFQAIFAASAIARAACLALLVRVHPVGAWTLPVVFRAVAVRPATGVVLKPILATVRRRRRASPHPETGAPDDEAC